MKKKKLFLSLLMLVCASVMVNAQDLASGIDEATDELGTIFDSVKTFLYILAAIVGLYGGFNVYSKYQAQDQDAAKAAAKYAFGFIFLMAAGFIIDAVFVS